MLLQEVTDDGRCPSCDAEEGLFVTFPKCGHKICLVDCWGPFAKNKISSGKCFGEQGVGLVIGCAGKPGQNPDAADMCKLKSYLNPALFKFLGKDTYEAYKMYGLRLLDFVQCPKPNCVLFEDAGDPRNKLLECPSCHFGFCRSCKKAWHTNECAPDEVVSANAKKCPKCQALIEKSEGCNHMACTNFLCNFEFCWMCLTEWGKKCEKAHWYDPQAIVNQNDNKKQ